MSYYKKMIFKILLVFITTLSINPISFGSHAKYICEDDGVAEPLYVHSVKIIGAGEATIQQWIKLIMEKENINNHNMSKAKGILGEIVAQILFEGTGTKLRELLAVQSRLKHLQKGKE
ncbi:hypothetical protein [Candidatus Paracaedibacter symbiosus]|uniref:hypothetical protein n=1 Tax=Candidatus Paracaedibacter symbiosus TaxID=244582 RepID=UPI0004F72AA4|nr:hypothetical protein [Candidatus Paracaedibacter symbiosus]AIL13753.1 hypothetical protein IM40_10135 [Candidatus Paracaedimonas acanthamoebae]